MSSPATNCNLTDAALQAYIESIAPGLHALGNPACFVSADGYFRFVNAAYCTLMGRHEDSLINRRIDVVLDVFQLVQIDAYMNAALQEGRDVSFDRTILAASGENRVFKSSYFPKRDLSGAIWGAIGTMIEIAGASTVSTAPSNNEAMLRHLADATGRMAFYIDKDFIVRYANKPYLAWINRSSDRVVGQSAYDLISKAGAQHYLPFANRAFAGETVSFESKSFSGVDQNRRIRMTIYPHLIGPNEVCGIYVTAQDVEAELQMRDQLLEKEQELKAIANNVGMPIVKFSTDLRFTFANRQACEWYSLEESEIIGRRIDDITGIAQYEQMLPFIDRALRGEKIKFEHRAKLPERDMQLRVSMLPQLNAQGIVESVLTVITDIEEDYLLRSSLMEQQRQLRLITNNIGAPISYVDRDLRFRFVNTASVNWGERNPNDFIGRHLVERFGETVFNEVKPYIDRAFLGETISYERLNLAAKNGPRWIRNHIVPDILEDGSVAGIYTLLTDIHDDVMLRKALQEQTRTLQLFHDNVPLSISYYDLEMRCRYANRAYLLGTGDTLDSIVGKSIADIIGAASAANVQPYFNRAVGGETVSYERRGLLFNKLQRWFNISMVPDFGIDGAVQGIYVVATDIDDAKSAQAKVERSEAELRFAIDSLPYPVAYIDKNLRYQAVNRQLELSLNKTRDELINAHVITILEPARFEAYLPYWRQALAGNEVRYERISPRHDGPDRWMDILMMPRRDANNEVIGFYVAATDIDRLKRVEIELKHANWLLSSHIENTPLGVIEWDAHFQVRRWSKQAEHIFGWSEAEAVGRQTRGLPLTFEADQDIADEVIQRLLTHNEPHTTSLNRNYRKDGSIIWVEWNNSRLLDESGAVVSVLSLMQDVTARVNAEQQLLHDATHDNLTGLPNRALLQDRLAQAIARARRNQTKVVALFLDLDRFKEVNDTLGHRVGDVLIKNIATRLLRCVRQVDLVARLSGDEFMVALEDIADATASGHIAEKLLEELRRPLIIDGNQVHVTCSIGISIYPDDAADVETLLKHADMAMYHAKEISKDTFHVYSSELAARGTSSRMLESAIRSALANHEFELFYQPKVDLKSNKILGAEALLRWRHPTQGLVMPGEFIHRAEETGLINQIGDWTLSQAFRDSAMFAKAGFENLSIAINIAAAQFASMQLAGKVKQKLKDSGANPRNIELELTETSLLRDPEGVDRTLRELKAIGLRVAVDDFGTGYSSLSHLKRFPIDTIKIDHSFVADLLVDKDSGAIVAAVIALAGALNIEVVAEGVESEAQHARLLDLGCGSYQGFLFSRAVPIAEFMALLNDSRDNELDGQDDASVKTQQAAPAPTLSKTDGADVDASVKAKADAKAKAKPQAKAKPESKPKQTKS